MPSSSPSSNAKANPGLAVSRACVLAREIIEIVRGYNELMKRSNMPELELGIGITLQETAPLYLMDGERQIMISEALNESDRLSSCNKRARKVMESQAGPFHVYVFQAQDAGSPSDHANPADQPNEDSVVSYNLGGIRMNQSAFRKLEQEISLVPLAVKLPPALASDKGEYRLSSGIVPVDRDIFRKIVVRESRVPKVNAEDFSVQGWTTAPTTKSAPTPPSTPPWKKRSPRKRRGPAVITRHRMPHPWQFHGWACCELFLHVHQSQLNPRLPATPFQCRQTCTAT